jgi:hypothetical protein
MALRPAFLRACAARAGLIDFGQSKQLTQPERLAFARLVLALSAARGAELLDVVQALSVEQQLAVSQGLDEIGIRLGPGSLGLRVRMAFGMFDTRGRCAALCCLIWLSLLCACTDSNIDVRPVRPLSCTPCPLCAICASSCGSTHAACWPSGYAMQQLADWLGVCGF